MWKYNSNELYHYGVLGMRWGHRKDPEDYVKKLTGEVSRRTLGIAKGISRKTGVYGPKSRKKFLKRIEDSIRKSFSKSEYYKDFRDNSYDRSDKGDNAFGNNQAFINSTFRRKSLRGSKYMSRIKKGPSLELTVTEARKTDAWDLLKRRKTMLGVATDDKINRTNLIHPVQYERIRTLHNVASQNVGRAWGSNTGTYRPLREPPKSRNYNGRNFKRLYRKY